MVQPSPSAIGPRYRLDDSLGGTAARVHRAHDSLLQRDVAIKTFPGEDGPQRWRRDAELRHRLGSGQVMEVLDGAPDGDDGPFVVMPLARGGSLDRTPAPWDPWPATVLVARLAVGLRRLHGLGDVHGGVAADAVLLDPRHGPRWSGHGAVPPAGATAEDDVVAFARVAARIVTGRPEDAVEPDDELVDAVRALVLGARGADDRERVRAGLAAHAARYAVPVPVAPLRDSAAPGPRSRRARATLLAACAAAAVLGGAVGLGVGVVGGGATAVASDVVDVAVPIPPPVGAVPDPVAPAAAVPPAPVAVPATAERREASRSGSDAGTPGTDDGTGRSRGVDAAPVSRPTGDPGRGADRAPARAGAATPAASRPGADAQPDRRPRTDAVGDRGGAGGRGAGGDGSGADRGDDGGRESRPSGGRGSDGSDGPDGPDGRGARSGGDEGSGGSGDPDGGRSERRGTSA